MPNTEETLQRLAAVPHLHVSTKTVLADHTRFGIGGPADIFAETADTQAFIAALGISRQSGVPFVVIGGGTNLIVSDEGYRGIVLKLSAHRIEADGTLVRAEGGAVLQDLVNFTIDRGMKGLET